MRLRRFGLKRDRPLEDVLGFAEFARGVERTRSMRFKRQLKTAVRVWRGCCWVGGCLNHGPGGHVGENGFTILLHRDTDRLPIRAIG